MIEKDENIIFLDIDGVLNCQILFEERNKKQLTKDVKSSKISRNEFYSKQLCSERIEWLNQLCVDTKSKVVISSTWRKNKTLEQMQEILKASGAAFSIIGMTPNLQTFRGVEIYRWIKEHLDTPVHAFKRYAIIDDNSDMLLWQANHLFLTDGYSGLTPNMCHRIKRFLQSVRDIEHK